MKLNDDCILEVLGWLSLAKIRLFSQSCKRIQGLCEGYFRRNFPEEASEAKIEVKDKVNLVYDDNVRYLHNSIENLKVVPVVPSVVRQSIDQTEYLSLTNFLKAKCLQNLNRITFMGDVLLHPFHNEISSYLQNVEIVNLMSRTISGQGGEVTFLSYCPNIKKLTLFNMVYVETVNAIFQETYHQLEHFHSMVINPMKLNTENLKMFFQHNNKIQCLVWKFVIPSYQKNDFAMNRVVDCVQIVVEQAMNLQHFFLLINSQLTKRFGDIISYFTALCDRDNFQSLEIEFDDTEAAYDVLNSHGNQLANFKQLTKIRLTGVELIELIPELRSLIHLKIIVLRDLFDHDNWLDWKNVSEQVGTQFITLPQVEELQIQGGKRKLITTYVMQFARHWSNLKRILLPECDSFNTTVHIAELNRARQKLKNACELTILTDNIDNGINVDHPLVKSKYMTFKHGFQESLFSKCCM